VAALRKTSPGHIHRVIVNHHIRFLDRISFDGARSLETMKLDCGNRRNGGWFGLARPGDAGDSGQCL
jgi:hypothetical protein